MKILSKVLYFFAFAALLNSCGKDDNNDNEALIGDWTATEFFVSVNSTGGAFTSTYTLQSANLDYDLTITETDFTANGDYDIILTSAVNGTTQQSNNSSYEDISRSGTYMVDGEEVTATRAFFDFLSVTGPDLSAFAGQQSLEFEIDSNGTLIFTQNETRDFLQGNDMISNKTVYTSKWVKQ